MSSIEREWHQTKAGILSKSAEDKKYKRVEGKNAVKEERGWRGHRGEAAPLFPDSKKALIISHNR